MDRQYDLCIIGGGPAGLAAACSASDCGLDVIVLDDQPSLGGQLYRGAGNEHLRKNMEKEEGEDGKALIERFLTSGAEYLPQATVWSLEPKKVSCLVNGLVKEVAASVIIIATGGMERPVPFPGWTMPGVMGAGAADIVLRTGGNFSVSKETPLILAGNGPLLLLLTTHLLAAGVPIGAWLDTGTMGPRLVAGLKMPAALKDFAYFTKGLGMGLKALKAKFPIIRGVTAIKAVGDSTLREVVYTKGGKEHSLPAGLLVRHEGIIPRTHIPQSLGMQLQWDAVQRYWHPVIDEWGQTSTPGVLMAGDGAYVHGGDASVVKGHIAGVKAACLLRVISQQEADDRTSFERSELKRLVSARGYLRHLFAPSPSIFKVPDHTTVCRCEGVSAGDIRAAVQEGYVEVNEIKRFTRCGMGPCQGRMCGPALAEITAAAQGKDPSTVGMLHIRPPFRPLSLQEYCNYYAPEAD